MTPSADNPFRARLRGGEPLVGLWNSLCSPIASELLSWTGFDWLLIDGEHAPNEPATFMAQLHAMKASPTAAICRPAWNDPVLIKRMLDIGVANFLIPFVQNGAEAEAAVRATRYPPAGIRGVAGMQRGNMWGNVADYFEKANDNITVIVQIETPAAIDELPDICAIPEVDGVFVGPSDLSAALGHIGKPGHPEVQAQIARALKICKDHGKAAGILAPVAADAERYRDDGFSFIAVGSDLGLLKANASQLAARLAAPSA